MAPTVVLVPGFMQRGSAWDGLRARLGGRYRSVALDHAGADLAARLAEIAAAAPPGAALAGYSLGGRLALHAALAAPGRYGALVLIGASAGIEDAAERRRRRAADERLARWIERRPIEQVVARWERLPAFASQPPALVAAQRPARLAHEPAVLARLLRTAGQGAMAPVWDRLGELGRLPVLALAGARDDRYAAAARRLAAAVANGRWALVPDAGHAAHLERPDAVARLLGDFLDDHLGERRLVDVDPEAGAGGHREQPA